MKKIILACTMILFISIVTFADEKAAYSNFQQQLTEIEKKIGEMMLSLTNLQVKAEEMKGKSDAGRCIMNLKLIQNAKENWAVEYGKAEDDEPTAKDLDSILRNGFDSFKCPAGGIYKINKVGEVPTCSIPGHVLVYQPYDASPKP